MNFGFHDTKTVKLTLASFEARVRLADHIDSSLAADNLTIRVTALGGFQ